MASGRKIPKPYLRGEYVPANHPNKKRRIKFLADFETACNESHGIITQICQAVGISRQTCYTWINKDADCAQILNNSHERTTDIVVGRLLKNINDGNQRAIEFWLTNRRSEDWKRRTDAPEPEEPKEIDVEAIRQRVLGSPVQEPGKAGA